MQTRLPSVGRYSIGRARIKTDYVFSLGRRDDSYHHAYSFEFLRLHAFAVGGLSAHCVFNLCNSFRVNPDNRLLE